MPKLRGRRMVFILKPPYGFSSSTDGFTLDSIEKNRHPTLHGPNVSSLQGLDKFGIYVQTGCNIRANW